MAKKKLELREVGPRDGLQNEITFVPTKVKIELIKRLKVSGLSYIEATAFVSPKAIPQMKDAKEVSKKILRLRGVQFSALAPNQRGILDALEMKYSEVAVFTAASETFTQKNIRASIDESFERFNIVFALAKKNKLKVRGYISTAFVCPYEGEIKINQVVNVAKRLLKEGCYEISIGDTVGMASTKQTEKLFKALLKLAPAKTWAGHFHDTYGLALANIAVAHKMGIYKFDSSVGGLGGCPYAPGAGGNVATENIVYWAEREGLETKIDLKKLCETADWIHTKIGSSSVSKVALAVKNRK